MTILATTSDINLFVNPADQSCIAEIDGIPWLVSNRLGGLVLCGYGSLKVDGIDYALRRERCVGRLQVTCENNDGSCRVQLVDWTGTNQKHELDIMPRHVDLHFSSWIYGYHADGWLDLTSEIEIEGADNAHFDFYLPHIENYDDGGKRVEILADGDVIAETIAQRGEVTRLHVALDGGAASVTLNIECEYAEPQMETNDIRLLGCIVSSLTLSANDRQENEV